MARMTKDVGDRIDRKTTVNFSFDGRSFSGLAGDTIASALLANGQWLVSRSFKYHRPRGVLGLSGDDGNTLVQLADEPNTNADRKLLQQDLRVEPQNCNGSLNHDPMAVLGLFSRFLPVGFYYKTFFRPAGAWAFWSKIIRKSAGLGKLDATYLSDGYIESESTNYDKQYLHTDTLVIGGGYHGMKAALDAAAEGHFVLLVDREPTLGGAMNLDASLSELRDSLVAEISAAENIRVETNTLCNGWYHDNWFALCSENRLYKVRAKESLVAVGALEQPAVFRNNDLPGVILGSAAQRMIQHYGIQPGKRAVIIAGNDEAYRVALDLVAAGTQVEAIVELRDEPSALAASIAEQNIRVIRNAEPHMALSSSRHVSGLQLRARTAPHLDPLSDYEVIESIDCDLICMSVGYMPAFQLPCQAGARLIYEDNRATFSIEGLPKGSKIVGASAGRWGLEQEEPSPNFPWPIFPHPKGKEFVDYDEDLTISDLINAVNDGFDHIQLLKRYSTNGMGPSQGRQSALASARIVAFATGKSVTETGITTARPPLAGVSLALSAGRSFFPARRTAMHHWHDAHGAVWLQAGTWYRPAFYRSSPEESDQDCITRENRQVRENVGLIDISTLGGIDIRGPDAAEFVNRIYTGAFKGLKTGHSRYALLCNEAGVVIDDGVACRIAEHHFYLTATSVGVDRVVQQMFRWNAEWRLDVDIANVTAAFAAMNVAGPNARRVLAKITKLELDDEAFPFMAVRQGETAGVEARLIRTGFVGELGYEIHVPQHLAQNVWTALMQAGEALGIAPFGVEAQRLLRLEKGHVIIGQDTDAMTTPMELDMGWALAWKKPFFLGKRTLQDLEKIGQPRKLIGFTIKTAGSPVPKESHLLIDDKQDKMIGRVTSCAYSPVLSQIVGLALLEDLSKSETGSLIKIRCDGGGLVDATVTAAPFYDPENQRQKPDDSFINETTGTFTPVSTSQITASMTTSTSDRLHLTDLSLISRQGYKGSGAIGYLQSQGAEVPDAPNKAIVSANGSMIARLSFEETLVIHADARFEFVPPPSEITSVYFLPRAHSHCCFQLSGKDASVALSKLTGIDLTPENFPNLNVAQTSIARVNGILIRSDLNDELAFYILTDTPSAVYLWDCIEDAIKEFNGN